ncbi:MAG TPA: efflux RND transporter periplasmic adaptor subunit [Porticoccaceae bacterium]|nr:efflux RND transporter periplasmic adaptor subunit [Porticoccaceae bacterium]
MSVQRTKRLSVVAILAAGLLLSYLIVAMKPNPAPQAPAPERAHPARVVAARHVDSPVTVISQGTVTPKTEIDVTSQVAGQVVEVSPGFAAGGFFAAGEVLLRIDPRDYEIRLVQAEARLAEARKTLALEQGQARQAAREWRELGNPEANALSLRKPQLAAAEAAVKAAEAEVRQARLDLERTAIRLPFAGRVASTEVNLGQYLTAGRALARVFSSEVMEVRLPLTAHQMRLLNLKADSDSLTPLAVSLGFTVDGHAYRWQGKVVRAEPRADPDSRLFHVVAEVRDAYDVGEDGHPPLLAGTFVEAAITSNPFRDVVALPRTALQQRDRVMVLDGEGRLRFAVVDVLQLSGDGLVVRGLDEGTLVLVEPPGFMEIGGIYEPVFVDGGESEG